MQTDPATSPQPITSFMLFPPDGPQALSVDVVEGEEVSPESVVLSQIVRFRYRGGMDALTIWFSGGGEVTYVASADMAAGDGSLILELEEALFAVLVDRVGRPASEPAGDLGRSYFDRVTAHRRLTPEDSDMVSGLLGGSGGERV